VIAEIAFPIAFPHFRPPETPASPTERKEILSILTMLASSSETRPEEKSNVPTPLAKKEVYWVVIAIVGFVHAVAILSLLFYTPSNHTVTMTLLNWIFGGLGITAGYHRLWSHNAYKSSGVTRFIFALMGTMGFQGSIKWWSLRHRLHHRYTDTEHDPYNATRGFWYSHMGWLFEKPEYTRLKWIDKSDLERDKGI
jgi:stearoyl-CoA desaturase (delta-9 desaturase)